MTEFYIVRHGETDSNTRQACLGLKDAEMNEKGQEQVRRLALRLKDVSFDAVYASPLSRTMETAQTITKNPIIMNYGFIERDFGIWDDMTFEEIEIEYPKEYTEWQNDFYHYSVPRGESSAHVQERVSKALDRILEKHKDERILIVTHLGAARHILSHLLGLSLEESWCFFVENGKYATVEIKNDRGILTGLNI